MDLDRRQLRDAEAPRSSEAVLSQQVSEIKTELEHYKAELAALRQQVVSPYQDDNSEAVAPTSRRRMLKHMVAGVAGVGALSLATMVGSSPIVQAETTGETAIDAQGGAGGYGGKFSSSFAQLQLVPAIGMAVPTSFAGRNTGEFFVDQNGSLFYAVKADGTAGTPDRWVKLAGPTTSGSLHLLNPPSRFIDTRPGGLNAINNPLSHQVARPFQLAGLNSLTGTSNTKLPVKATGVLGNITVVGASTAGYLQIGPNTPGGSDPSALNFNGGTIGNNFASALNSAGSLTLLISLSNTAATVHVIIDITGYYY